MSPSALFIGDFFLNPDKIGVLLIESAIHCRRTIRLFLGAYSIRPYIVFFNWRNVILIEQALHGIVDSIDKESNAQKTP
ncbi:hypothetical protein J7L68_07560 [bacterium]|nr:hypothetical protein [bacterium]